jgi:PAS domain-containing protein
MPRRLISLLLICLVTFGLVNCTGSAPVKEKTLRKDPTFTIWWREGYFPEGELNDVREQVNVILRLNRRPFDKELVAKLKQNPNYTNAYERLDRTFKNIRAIKPQIDQISILNRGGYVLYSTDREKEGKYLSLGNTTTYFTKEERDLYKPTFYSAPNGKPSITFATPILNAEKQVVAVDLNLQDIDRLIRERTGLGKTGETYVVGSLETKVTFLASSEDKGSANEFKDGVTSFAIEQVMQGKDNLVIVDADSSEETDARKARANRLYNNYRGVPVIGVYNWIDDLNLGMIAEMSQAEAFAPADILARETFQLGLSAAGLLLVAVYLLSRRITQRKRQLTAVTSQMADGLILVNAENRIVQCNRSLADLVHLVTEFDLVGCTLAEAFTGAIGKQLANLVANAANNPEQIFAEQIIVDESIYTGTVLLFRPAN